MQFPLSLTFKVAALAPQIYVHDASGRPLCYVRQKLFKLKEHILVFKDESKTQLISEIHADRIIDFSAAYTFKDPNGLSYGSVKRRGLSSIWRTRYEVQDENSQYIIREGNPWTKVLDGFVGEIPLLGMLTGYILNPHYDVLDAEGRVHYSLRKLPSFFGRKFSLERRTDNEDDLLIIMSLIMMVLLERRRG